MPTSNIKQASLRKDQNNIVLWKCSSCKYYVEVRHKICNWCKYDGELKYVSKEDEIQNK